MNVLVTGANGLLGHHVIFELMKEKHSIRVIVRNTKSIFFDFSKIEIFQGNFMNRQNLKQAAKGCDAIIHIAGVTATNLLYFDDYRKINVDGTAMVLKVANELNINTVVYVSSSNTIGFGSEQQPADERLNIEFPFTKSFYARSKFQAERLMIEASKLPNKRYVIINPTFMLGAYDSKPSSGKLILMGYNRKLLFIPKGGKNFVSANDVAKSICNALIQGNNGEKYLASGYNLSFKEYYEIQKQIGNYKQYIVEMPNFLLILIGKIGDLLRFSGVRTELCSMNLRQLIIQEYYNNQKAKSELNMPQTEVKVAAEEAINWFKENGMI
ncbi:MAG: NAD-dependent epimerase/dehydratase family protein [Paludibacter sp.]|nr:NAD-dependent epimerase/dehydratase family protein [Paludibacter sp.]